MQEDCKEAGLFCKGELPQRKGDSSDGLKMALNPNYDSIGKSFTETYYGMFDDPARRAQLVTLYNVSICQGQTVVMVYFAKFSFFWVWLFFRSSRGKPLL